MRMRTVACVLAMVLLVTGCTPSPVLNGDPTPPIPPTAPLLPSATPTAPESQSASEMADGFALVTVADDDYGLAPPPGSRLRLITWAEQYCEKEGLSPCAGIQERAVDLCIEKWDCHPAVLVPFMEGTAAFLTGGIFPEPQIVAVWRPEAHRDVERFGGARRLLEAYLLTVGVCPDTGDEHPQGEACPRMEENTD